MLDVVITKPAIRLVHVADYDREMLEPEIVAVRVCRNRASLRCEIFGKLDFFIPQPQASNTLTRKG